MPAPLATYRRKRNFDVTSEPVAQVAPPRSRLIYVIQRHEASRLHWDFRLELDGVLVSWAVPKEPSTQVGVRRLAVHVEDHPVAYANFEGDIPKGEYGGGHVDIWDRGVWTPMGDARKGLREGHLSFELAGERLNGRYALIRMQPRDGERAENWLLIRERDRAEAPAAPAGARRQSADANEATRGSRAMSGRKAPPTMRVAAAKTRTAAGKRTAGTNGDSASRRSQPTVGEAIVAGVRITNPERRIVHGEGATKLDAVRYHEQMAAWLIPQVCARPLALLKCPGGDFDNCFFQKHSSDPRRPARTTAGPGDPPYMRLADLAAVVTAVQNGAFEFHTWGCRFPRLDRPDRIVLDLDPDSAVSFDDFRDAAARVRDLLDALDLRWFLKTTGGKGLHFVVPLQRRYTWQQVKDSAAAMARKLVAQAPALFIATASKAERAGKVFVDYLRNADGATAVAAYSLRARAGLPVSMPIGWSALERDVRGAYFNLHNAPAWVQKRKSDPWAEYGEVRQALPRKV